MIPDFECADLADQVARMDEAGRDGLPYDVIRLDLHGLVNGLDRTQAEALGRKSRVGVGLDVFKQAAPYMATPEMRGRVEAAARRGAVDIEIGWIGDDPEGEIQIRVMSASDGGLWLFMNRDAS